MAVKRVILQHFSMRYDYMTKERPNIYQPSSINCPEENGDYKINEKVAAINKSIMGRSSTNDLESKLNKISRGGGVGGGGENESRRRDEMNYKKSFNRSLDNSGGCLDSITELKEKLPEIVRRQRKLSNCDVKEVNGVGEIKKMNKIIPEENWRYRSSSNSVDASPSPLGFRNYRNFNHHNNPVGSSRHHSNSSSSCESNNSSGGVGIKNWRNECIYSAVRNCGMISTNGDGRTSINISNDDDDDDCIVGLSPPSESILMQRRLRNRASEILCSPSATASG